MNSSGQAGSFHLGPFYLTPTFHIGSVGLDTNVYFAADEAQSDISAQGGPGLDIVLPIKKASSFYVQGALNYTYFLNTPSQRSLNGSASTGVALQGGRTNFSVVESYSTAFNRPSTEVNDRVQQTLEQTSAALSRRLFWRIGLTLEGQRGHYDTAAQDYLGTDLQKTLSHDEYLAQGSLSYAITAKTSFVVEGERRWYQYPLDPTRNGTWDRWAAGLQTDPSALISGEAMVGVRTYHPESGTAGDLRTTWVGVSAAWNVSPRTQFPFRYGRDRTYSAFATVGGTPTVLTETMGFGIEKQLRQRVDLVLFARQIRSTTDGPIIIDIPDQGLVVAVREDKAREYGAQITYLFRSRLRMGVTATYVDNNSSISYFGLEGLVIGVTVQYNP